MEGAYRVVESEYKIIEEKPFPAYWNSSVLKPRNFYATGLEESLEKIVLEDEAMQQEAPGERVFADKGRTLKATIKALFNEILTRERLNHVLLGKIDSDICKAGTYLEDLRRFTARDYSRQFEILGRRRTQIEDRVIGLEKEKRQEYLTCWKDLGQLKKYVLSALKDYWNVRGSSHFLNSDHDDRYRAGMQETKTFDWRQGG
jgi:hypothetical protein